LIFLTGLSTANSKILDIPSDSEEVFSEEDAVVSASSSDTNSEEEMNTPTKKRSESHIFQLIEYGQQQLSKRRL
jgi:hypothetical protein